MGLLTRSGGARSRTVARERRGLGVKGGGTSRGGGADRRPRRRPLRGSERLDAAGGGGRDVISFRRSPVLPGRGHFDPVFG